MKVITMEDVNRLPLSGLYRQESPADAVKPARRKSMPKLLQFDVFRFISPGGTAAAAPPPSGLATLPSVGAVP